MENKNEANVIMGRKIFFLHPSATLQNTIISELFHQEYEVYVVKDHAALRRALHRYSNSVVFADIGEHLAERDWEIWIRGVMNAPETKNTLIGIVSANSDEALQKKYLNTIKVPCGYTVIKSDINNSIKSICEILKSVDAKGRRKYLRASTQADKTTINLPMNGTFINGTIKDISAVGVSCTFERDPMLNKNALFKDIQIRLQGVLLKAEAIVFGSRMEDYQKIYVLLFTQRVDAQVHTKIRTYIQQNLQGKLDAELK